MSGENPMGVASGESSWPVPKNGVMAEVLSYQRVSKEEAQTGSHTFETQEDRIRELLEKRFGGKESVAYSLTRLKDDGVSGGYGPEATGVEKRIRKTLLKVREQLRTGKYDVFVVYNTDRFARSPRWFLQMLEDDILPFTTFISVTEDLNFDTSNGRVMGSLFAVVNGYMRDKIIERNRDAVATRTRLGYFQGQTPFGWVWEERPANRATRRRIIPNPEQGMIVVRIKDWYLAGWSLQRIANELNEQGIDVPITSKPEALEGLMAAGHLPSGLWNYTTILKIVSSPVHAGLINSKRYGLVKGEHWDSRYYDPEVRDQLTAARAGRRKFSPTNTGALTDDRLLNGFLTCAGCESRLRPACHSNGKWRGYRCRNRSASIAAEGAEKRSGQPKATCPLVSVSEEEIDAAVVGMLRRVAEEPAMRSLIASEMDRAASSEDQAAEAEATLLRKSLGDLNAQRERLLSALSRELIQENEFASQIAVIRQGIAKVQTRLLQAESALAQKAKKVQEGDAVLTLLDRFPLAWEHLDLMERREVLRQLVERVTVEVDEGKTGTAKSGNVTSIVRIKMLLLPEQTMVLERQKHKRREKTAMGFAGLSPRHLAYLYHRGEGKDRKETCHIMEVCHQTAINWENTIKQRVNLQDFDEIIRIARSFVRARLETLPLEGAVGRRAIVRAKEAAAIADPRYAEVPFYLSTKLMEIFPLYANGASSKQIAEITGLPLSTITGRKQMILELTGCKTVFDAGQLARKHGLL